MSDTITHLAGPVVGYKGRIIQRCAVCGQKLCDNLNVAMTIDPDGGNHVFPTWTESNLIRVQPGDPTVSRDIGSFTDEKIAVPEDFCLQWE